MERMLKNFWIFSTLLAISAPAAAESWESVIRKISHNKKSLSLTSSLQQYPSYKATPKVIGFSGVVKLPSQISLINGSSKVHANAGQIIIDNQVVCDYSPKSNKEMSYSLVGCSDGSQAGDDIIVNQKIVLKLNQAASDESAVSASLKIVRT